MFVHDFNFDDSYGKLSLYKEYDVLDWYQIYYFNLNVECTIILSFIKLLIIK